MWLLSFDWVKLPGSAAARSRPTDGFSAMTSVLAMASFSVATAPTSMSAGSLPPPPVRLAGRDRHDGIGHPEARALPAADARREDRGEHASAAVHHRPARVAGTDPPAQ